MNEKCLFWVGSSKKDLLKFPEQVKRLFGFALGLAQNEGKHFKAKPLKGFGSAGILEVVEDFHGNTFRAVYTVQFNKAVYCLHVFQKKSTRGIQTPQHEIELVRFRLRQAEVHYNELLNSRTEKNVKS